MTEHRRPEIRFTDAPRGTCRWCGDPILHAGGAREGQVNRRRRWHQACVDAYNLTDPREQRRRVRKRDRGVCFGCGLDTNALRRSVRGPGRSAKLRAKGFLPRRSLWELDHKVPLVDGGTHEDSNLQTLCVPCHRQKSAEEARARAARGRSVVADAHPAESSSNDEEWLRLIARADRANARAEELLSADRVDGG